MFTPRLICCAALVAAIHPMAVASDALASRVASGACHQAERKTIGPPWKDIATKYADGSKSAAQIAATIRAGSKGTWGPVPMPPQPAVSEADAATLAAWVLNRK